MARPKLICPNCNSAVSVNPMFDMQFCLVCKQTFNRTARNKKRVCPAILPLVQAFMAKYKVVNRVQLADKLGISQQQCTRLCVGEALIYKSKIALLKRAGSDQGLINMIKNLEYDFADDECDNPIRRARMSLGLSIGAVSKATGITWSKIQRLETGRTPYGKEIQTKILDYFTMVGLADDLMGDLREMAQRPGLLGVGKYPSDRHDLCPRFSYNGMDWAYSKDGTLFFFIDKLRCKVGVDNQLRIEYHHPMIKNYNTFRTSMTTKIRRRRYKNKK